MSIIITPPSIQINDEGVSQGQAAVVNYVGAGVTATVTGNTATVTIAGASSTGINYAKAKAMPYAMP